MLTALLLALAGLAVFAGEVYAAEPDPHESSEPESFDDIEAWEVGTDRLPTGAYLRIRRD
jgi:hypothetical protein